MKYLLVLSLLDMGTHRYTCEYPWGSIIGNTCGYLLTHEFLTCGSGWSMGKNLHRSGCEIWHPNTCGYGSRSPMSALVPSPRQLQVLGGWESMWQWPNNDTRHLHKSHDTQSQLCWREKSTLLSSLGLMTGNRSCMTPTVKPYPIVSEARWTGLNPWH